MIGLYLLYLKVALWLGADFPSQVLDAPANCTVWEDLTAVCEHSMQSATLVALLLVLALMFGVTVGIALLGLLLHSTLLKGSMDSATLSGIEEALQNMVYSADSIDAAIFSISGMVDVIAKNRIDS